DNDLLRLLSAGSILAGGAAPIPVQGIVEEVNEQREAGEFDPLGLAQTALAETASLNLIPVEDQKKLDSKSQSSYGASFDELDHDQRRELLKKNPDLASVAKDHVKEQLQETGYKEAESRAWNNLAPEFGVSGSYEDYREDIRSKLAAEGMDANFIERALRTDPLIVAYHDLKRGYQFEWVAEHADDL